MIGRDRYLCSTIGLFCLGFFLGGYVIQIGLIPIPVVVNIKGSLTDDINACRCHGNGSYLVPNIVHFIWFGKDKEMSFINYVSILSAHKIQKPDVIMFHCNHLPRGEWWQRLWKEVPLKIVYKQAPRHIHGQKLLHTYHQGDVAKMEILMKYGGIYIDYDVIMVQSFDPLRRYPMTFGKEITLRLNAGIMIACRHSLFLSLMYESYRNNYRPFDWDYNCQRLTYQMYVKRPDLVHVERKRLTTPDYWERHLLVNTVINWQELYCVHLMLHLDWTNYTPEVIAKINNTFGEVIRNIYYGSPSIR